MDLDAAVIFLGDGDKRQNLINKSKELPSNMNVNFKGRVSRDLAIEHMLEADISISLSKGEGLPIAILESMYAGCYMILSKIPPHTEIFPPQERCSFVKIDNQEDVINSLLYAREEIENIRKSRSVSREYSVSKFSVNNMLRDYVKIYESISKTNSK